MECKNCESPNVYYEGLCVDCLKVHLEEEKIQAFEKIRIFDLLIQELDYSFA